MTNHQELTLCECGCGRKPKKGNRFINGHNLFGNTHAKGNIPWNKGKTINFEEFYGKEKSRKIKKKISESNKGRKFSKDHKRKIGNARKGKLHTKEAKIKCGIKNKGRRLKDEHKKKITHFGEKNPAWKGGYCKRGIAVYDKYASNLKYGEKTRRNFLDKNVLEVTCTYCGKWFIPKVDKVWNRIRCLNGKSQGECRFYCSDKCKSECSIFNQTLYPKGFKSATSREVQPELRQMRFEIDNYTCQKCKKHQDELEVGLHCHHIEGIRWEPLESADVDKVITYCKTCHIKVHQIEGCGYNDMKCNLEQN